MNAKPLENSPVSSKTQSLVPGILGGLGPLAHVELERRLLNRQQMRSSVRQDQDYPAWNLISAAKMPDRTAYLEGKGENPLPMLLHCALSLQQIGSHFLVVPCNTAHAFYEPVQRQLNIPWLHLMDHTARYIQAQHPQARRVGVLATNGTVRTGLYHQSLNLAGLECIEPPLDGPLQKQVMESIYHSDWGIKATGTEVSFAALRILSQAVEWLRNQDVDLVIAGCTEISVAFSYLKSVSVPWIDPMDVIADLTLDLAEGTQSITHHFAA